MTTLEPGAVADLMGDVPVVPVLTIDRAADAVPLAVALLAGGLRVLEVTLRTSAALESVARIAAEVPQAVVGVGSLIEPGQFAAARVAGARFAVSPGWTRELEAEANTQELPWLPAAQTVSEILMLRAKGYRFMKLFPAESCGGTGFLRSIFGPVPDVRFCPTGGITAANARSYLALPNVSCVGGSWLASRELLSSARWAGIRELARNATRLREARLAS